MGKGKDQGNEIHCTDIDALKDNTQKAVDAFAQRWLSLPQFTAGCEIMDQRQLRDMMGLRSTIEAGDPWPLAESLLLRAGFRWHQFAGCRVMFLREREDSIVDDGWSDGELVES